MKSCYTLAWREIKGQKLVSFLIIIAMVLSTMMTTAAGQSAGILKAMREQQAITIGGDRYASFVQLTEEQAQALERDERFSYTGRYIQLGSMTLNDLLSLDLAEYWGDGLRTRPAYTKLVEGRLPKSDGNCIVGGDIAVSGICREHWRHSFPLTLQSLAAWCCGRSLYI